MSFNLNFKTVDFLTISKWKFEFILNIAWQKARRVHNLY